MQRRLLRLLDLLLRLRQRSGLMLDQGCMLLGLRSSILRRLLRLLLGLKQRSGMMLGRLLDHGNMLLSLRHKRDLLLSMLLMKLWNQVLLLGLRLRWLTRNNMPLHQTG